MIIYVLTLLYTVCAKIEPSFSVKAESDDIQSQLIYTRLYLRGLKRLENQRIQSEYINRGIAYIEDSVFTAAKQGLVKFSTEPFEGCEIYVKTRDFDKAVCENIVNGIQTLVSLRFPDSDLLYDSDTKRYTLKWD
jgi:hypothetical protein